MPQGYQVTFFTQQDRQHHHQPVAEWLLATAKNLGIGGATMVLASQGFGHHKHIHAAHFFELGDQPVLVIMVVTDSEWQQLHTLLQQEQLSVFFSKVPAEFGLTT